MTQLISEYTEPYITSELSVPKMSPGCPETERLRRQLIFEVVRESRKSREDPSYKETTAREKYALSKGVNFDSQSLEKIDFIAAEVEKEILSPHSLFVLVPVSDHDEKKDMMWHMMALLEWEVFGEGKSEESQLAIESQVTGRVKDKESDVHVAGSAISPEQGEHNETSKGKEEKSKLVLDDVANGKGKAKDGDMLAEGSNVDRGAETQSEPLMGGPKTKKRKKKSKKHTSSSNTPVTTQGPSKEHDMLVKGSTPEEGKGKECAATENGKAGENDVPPAETKMEGKNDTSRVVEVSTLEEGKGKECAVTENGKAEENDLHPVESQVEEQNNNDNHEVSMFFGRDAELLDEAAALVFPESNTSTKSMFLRLTYSSDSQASNPKLIEATKEFLRVLKKMYDVMELVIRPQTASPYELDLFCRFVRDPDYFQLLAEVIGEFRWNR